MVLKKPHGESTDHEVQRWRYIKRPGDSETQAGGRKPETEAETRDRSTGSVIMVLLTQWYTYRSAEETHVSFVRGFAA